MAAMDDTTRLVSELHKKLADLNGRVSAYQQDMVIQFRKHLEDCLKDCPDEVSREVNRVINESMSKYPALNVDLAVHDEVVSQTADKSGNVCNGWTGRGSPPPVLHTSGTPKDRQRSPHQREKEFHGVFTPSYLPLLDSNERKNPDLSPPAASASTPALGKDIDASKNTPLKSLVIATSVPCRRMTHHSSSSVESTGSDLKQRRSALRRSSSSVKCSSPRRVRFDFEGKEVFPASPQVSRLANMLDRAVDSEINGESDTSAIITEDEPSRYNGTSLLDIEGEEDMVPRPKKVSSTQALRALSKNPLDGGTTWEMVSSTDERVDGSKVRRASQSTFPELIPGVPVLSTRSVKHQIRRFQESSVMQQGSQKDNGEEDTSEEEFLAMKPRAREVSFLRENENDSEEEPISLRSRSRGTATPPEAEDGDSSEEEFLSMKPRARGVPSSPSRSPIVRNFSNDQVTVEHVEHVEHAGYVERARDTSANESSNREEMTAESPGREEDEDLFGFDADDDLPSTSWPPRTTKYLPDEEDEEVTSIADPRELTPPLEPPGAGSSLVSPSAAVISQVLGSYKGNPVRILPIKNSQLYDEVANMHDVPFWVGSVDGRSGTEAADLGSYRASLARGVLGTPKTFIERLAVEETIDNRRSPGDATDDEEQV